MNKTVTPRIWKSWKTVAEPSATHGRIKEDESGRHWEWMTKVQNIRVKLVPCAKTLMEVFRQE